MPYIKSYKELEKCWECNKIVAETGKTVIEVWGDLTKQEQNKNKRKKITT